VRNELADDRQHRVALLVVAEQRAQDVEHRAAERRRAHDRLRLVDSCLVVHALPS
jgi:hypothetical protein